MRFSVRLLASILLGLLLGTSLSSHSLRAQPEDLSVTAVTLTVDDLDRAVPFYRDVLSFTPVDTLTARGPEVSRLLGVFGVRGRVVQLRLGRETIRLLEVRTPRGRPIPPDSRSNDLWFQHVAIVVRDLPAAFERLRRHDVPLISAGPQTLPESIPAAAGISAVYFRDPTGNPLELIHYPPDKGRSRWHRDADSLVLGIDHTALAVADTERSLAFYRDQLGFRVAGGSVNVGPEQERLTGVFGARVRITALRPPNGGIGIELLEYQSPSTGRPFPRDTKTHDLWHAHVHLRTAQPEETTNALLDANTPFVSPGLVSLPSSGLGPARAAMIRDPTGHALLLSSPSTDLP
jgi:catechol 2,3-dioxygenase-like lactoylglutathione lyase family enzyme